mgnify:FL=1
MILKKFLKFPKSEARNSYEMDSYKKKCGSVFHGYSQQKTCLKRFRTPTV